MDTQKFATVQEFLESMAELRAKQKEIDEMLSKKFAETDEMLSKRFAETDERMRKTDERLEKMGIHLGGISNNNGEMAEEFFYRSLQEKLNIAGVQYDDIGRHWFKSRNGIAEEYDIVLTNGKAIEIVEVKYKVHPDDVYKLQRKKENFKKLFPLYEGFTIYASLAGMSIPNEVIVDAKQKGFHVLVAKGNHAEEL